MVRVEMPVFLLFVLISLKGKGRTTNCSLGWLWSFGRKNSRHEMIPLSSHARKYVCGHCHNLHFAHGTKASAIDSVGQVWGRLLKRHQKATMALDTHRSTLNQQ